jgi:hypothetical protein
MANHADEEYGPTPPGAAYEHTDVDPAVGYRFAVWLGIALLLSSAIVYGVFLFYGRLAVANDEAVRTYPLARGQSQEPPSPRLQTQPFKDIYELKGQQLGALTSYGWVDKGTGVTHIPIDRAIELTLQRGLPARANGPDAASLIVQDSSGGRTSAPR